LSVLENRAHLALPLRGPIRAGRTYDGRRPHSMRCFCNCEGGVRRMATAVPSRQQARYGVRRCRAAVCLGHLALLVTFPFSETECSRTFIFILCRHLGQMEWTSVDKKSKYPPAEPGALGIGPLEAAVRGADATLHVLAT
jgi:hypothetical protein